MAEPVTLVPLACPRCSTPVPARPEEMAYVCANCGQGMALHLEAGLQTLEVFYHTGVAPNQIGRPFWVAEGRVQVDREMYSGNKDRQAKKFWGRSRLFFVPAYTLPLENLLEIGAKMVERPPKLVSGPVCRFMTVSLPRADMTAVAEFIVMEIEADRRDKLKEVHLQVALGETVLWILP